MVVVPQIDDPKLSGLLAFLNIAGAPYIVAVRPESDALSNECLDNVQAKIDRNGGERVIGWQLWQHPFMLEAEYHAVWRSPDGILVDISPKNIETNYILFIDDESRLYDSRQFDNARFNTTTSQLVNDFIALAETKFFLFNYGDWAYQKIIHPAPDEREILKLIVNMMNELGGMINQGKVKKSQCFCNSGMKYKHCHGQDLISCLN